MRGQLSHIDILNILPYFFVFFGGGGEGGFPKGLWGDVFDTIVNKSYTGLNS